MNTSPQYATCEVKLTRDELLDLGTKLSNELGKIADLKSQLSVTQSVVKGKLLEHEDEVKRLSRMIREGKEEREVETEEQPDYANRSIITLRKDNWQEISHRMMRDDEIQKHFQKELFVETVSESASVNEAEAIAQEEPIKYPAEPDRTVAEAAGVTPVHRMKSRQKGVA